MIDLNSKFSQTKNRNKKSNPNLKNVGGCGCSGESSSIIHSGGGGVGNIPIRTGTVWGGYLNGFQQCGTDHFFTYSDGDTSPTYIDTYNENCGWAIPILASAGNL